MPIVFCLRFAEATGFPELLVDSTADLLVAEARFDRLLVICWERSGVCAIRDDDETVAGSAVDRLELLDNNASFLAASSIMAEPES